MTSALFKSRSLWKTFAKYAAVLLFATVIHLVLISMSLTDRHLQQQEFLYAIVALIPALILLFTLVYRQKAKIENISAEAQLISRGNFERRLPEEDMQELQTLAAAVNNMARSSARQVTELTTDRNRLETIFAGMVEGVIDVDINQKIVHINDAATRLLQINVSDSIGKFLWEQTRNQDIISAVDKAIKKLSVIESQTIIDTGSASLEIEIYVASLSDDSGTPIGAAIVLNDITDIRNLERVRTDFVANASHELKTPITAIRGIAETMLADKEVGTETVMHFMGRIHAQSMRLSQLVGDLMTLSRLESRTEEEMSSVNFTELVRRSVNAAESFAAEKNLQLILHIPEQKMAVFGDAQNLSQLVDNLIDNAIKYTDTDGQVEVSLEAQGEELLMQVRDNGLGISPRDQKRIFERFYRVDKVRSLTLGGTGLGLSIVKNIAEKHGAKISVQSQLGRGSTFIFRIPLYSLDAMSAA